MQEAASLDKIGTQGYYGNKMQEEIKENEMIKVVPTSETDKPTPLGDSVGECGICLDNLSDIMLPCLHAFCNQCIALW